MTYSKEDIERVVKTLNQTIDSGAVSQLTPDAPDMDADLRIAIAILKECGEKEAKIAKLRERVKDLEGQIQMME